VSILYSDLAKQDFEPTKEYALTTLVILQPGFLPWLGFFDQMSRSDIFVYYDDVQFDKHGWRNRNRIKTPSGAAWVTVPCLHRHKLGQRILDTEIDNQQNWARKIMGTIIQNYARARFLSDYLPELERLLAKPWRFLVDVDLAAVDMMCGWIDLRRPLFRSSELGIQGDRNARLVGICQHFSATRYLSGSSARSYLDEGLFRMAGIDVTWQEYKHPIYHQLHGEFVPFLSTIDLMFNAGPSASGIIRG
jgi:hypothetical protein